MSFRSVLLPQPDGPRRTRNSPCADLEVDVLEGDHRAVALRDGDQLDSRLGRIGRGRCSGVVGGLVHCFRAPASDRARNCRCRMKKKTPIGSRLITAAADQIP